MQVRGSAQPLGKGGRKQHYRPAARCIAQAVGARIMGGKQRIELGPAGFHDLEVVRVRGQRLERRRGGRPLRAVQVEHAAHTEMTAIVFALFDVEAMEQLHLGAGDEARHPVGGAEDRARTQRHRFAGGMDHPRIGQVRRAGAIDKPGMHAMTTGLQRIGQRLQDGQRIAFGCKQQVLRH